MSFWSYPGSVDKFGLEISGGACHFHYVFNIHIYVFNIHF